MRKVILSIQMSPDGFIEGTRGVMDWIVGNDDESWSDLFNVLESADTFLTGGRMYPGYEAY
ncbi:MAG TPA: hypothetical protein VD816_16285 [Ohtaekwangia sp.]|nr:hypothetical protein [Ohtaekwangia sp.]